MSGELAGRVAIVTGGAEGIGLAIARALAAAGAPIAVFDLAAADPDGAARAFGAHGYAVDMGDGAAVAGAVAEVAQALGPPRILVNNAARRTPRAKITELAVAEWEAALRVNVTGAFHLCRAALPRMAEAGGGSVINVASQLGSVAVPGAAAYCTTKGALKQFTRALALDHAGEGIRVNTLSPGAVLTGRVEALHGGAAAAEAALAPAHPIGRIGRAEEIAEAAVFLASDRSSFMTGADLVVDGGYTAR